MATRATFGGSKPGQLHTIVLDHSDDYGPWDVRDYQSFSLQLTGGGNSPIDVTLHVSNNPDPNSPDSEWWAVNNTWRVQDTGTEQAQPPWQPGDWVYGDLAGAAYVKLTLPFYDSSGGNAPTVARLLFSQSGSDRPLPAPHLVSAQGGNIATTRFHIPASYSIFDQYTWSGENSGSAVMASNGDRFLGYRIQVVHGALADATPGVFRASWNFGGMPLPFDVVPLPIDNYDSGWVWLGEGVVLNNDLTFTIQAYAANYSSAEIGASTAVLATAAIAPG